MAKLPKNLIKKYGISKKAWAVFRGQKATTTKKGRVKMAKKRYFGKKSKGHSKAKSFSFGSVLKILGGAVAAAAYEVFVSPMIPQSR